MPFSPRPTITAFERSPDGGKGLARDMRVRWALEEVRQPYDVRPISFVAMKEPAHRELHPFGQIPTFEDGNVALFESGAIVLHIATCQVPVLRETGRPTLFESGAIVLDLAERSGMLWPAERDAQAWTWCWVVAALNSVEPYLSNVAEVDFFTDDEVLKELRRPGAVAAATGRLGKLAASLGDRPYLVSDEFIAVDLMLASVLRVAEHADLRGNDDDDEDRHGSVGRCGRWQMKE
jgi:glutathione S-transferase